jgi:hypothetical protein
VRVAQARGLPHEERIRPYVRVRILDPEGKEKQVKETAPITDGGRNPQWNQYLKFEGIEDPALCSVCLEIRDKSDTKEEPAEGVAKVKLGVLGAASGFQQFGEILSDGWFSDVDLSFGLNNFGTWGNGARVENKLSINIMGADGMEDMDPGFLGLAASANDPYVYIELVDEDDYAIAEPRQTKVIWEGGKKADWNETFEFDDLLFPSACKLKLSVWDKDTLTEDDDLGKMEFALGRCFRVAEPMPFEEKLDVGSAKLKFSICTGGAWGALTKEQMPQERKVCDVVVVKGSPELSASTNGTYQKCDRTCNGLPTWVKRDEAGVEDLVLYSTRGGRWAIHKPEFAHDNSVKNFISSEVHDGKMPYDLPWGKSEGGTFRVLVNVMVEPQLIQPKSGYFVQQLVQSGSSLLGRVRRNL